MRLRKINMCEGPLLGPMLRFSLPIMFTSFLQQLFNAADVILAGQLLSGGSNMVAAVGSTTALTGLLVNFFIGCSTGGAVTVSHAIGSKNNEQIHKAIHTAISLSFIIGAILTVGGFFAAGPLLQAMDTPSDIISHSTAYLQVYFMGMIPYMVYNFSAAVLRSIGETQKPLFFLIISGSVKICLMFLFVSALDFGITGLALSTAVSQLVSAILGLLALTKRKDVYQLRFRQLRFHKGPLKKILLLGIPSGIQSTTFSLSNVLIQTHINSLEVLPGFIAGNAAAVSLINFADAVTGAFYQTALNFTGQNVGAKNYPRVKKLYFTASGLSSAVIAVVSLTVVLLSEQLLGIYITDSQDAIAWGKLRLMYIFVPLIFQGLMDVTSGTLRGMGITISNTIVSLTGVCGFRITWCFTVFQLFHTPDTLFLCYPISWIITYLAQVVILIFVYKKRTALPIAKITPA